MDKVHKELKRKFWTQFTLANTEGYENIYVGNKATVKNGIKQHIKFDGISIYANLNLDEIKVTLVIHSNYQEKHKTKEENKVDSIEENNKILSHLERNSHKIQKHFPENIFWKKSDFTRKIIVITNEGLQYEKQSDWSKINDWFIKTSYLLKKSTEEVMLSYNG